MTQTPHAFEAIALRHHEMLPDATHVNATLTVVDTEAIKSLVTDAAAAGTGIVEPAQRREVQNIIRFWTAELITRGDLDWAPPTLAEARVAQEIAGEEETSPDDARRTLARSREAVRIAASARQWKQSGDAGWLLKGDALREAQRFAHEDRTIEALVEASQRAEQKNSQLRWASLSGMSLVLAGLCVWLFFTWQRAEDLRQRADEARLRAEEQAQAANAEAGRAGAIAKELRDTQELLRQRGEEQQQQLNDQRKTLFEVAEAVRRLRDERKLPAAQIPAELQPLIAELDQKASGAKPPQDPANFALPPENFLRGYDRNFLQSASATDPGIPMPALSPRVAAQAYENGRPLHYVNFSLVLHKTRRMPVFTAVNLKRSGIDAIARAPILFGFDPRAPRDLQMPPANFSGNDLDRGNLVNAREIAWGPAFAFKGDADAAGELAYGLTTLMTNVVPQFDTFNQGLWSNLERYSQQTFSTESDRVSIFTGPVLDDADPQLYGMAVPRAFWKVLVTMRPDNPASLMVQAYLASQFREDGKTKIDRSTRFDAKVYRVRVTEIERLTGLDFGELIRAADAVSAPVTHPAAQASADTSPLVLLLQQSVGPGQAQRREAVPKLLAAMADKATPEPELRALAEDLVAYASNASLMALSWEARVNILILLGGMPKAYWDRDGWIDLKAVARRAVADAGAALPCDKEKQACETLPKLRTNLDWDLAKGRKVYVQFAGMVREDVVALNTKLKMLGWSVQGDGERIASAARKNEVRFAGAADDQRAGELLAADLRSLGRSTVKAVRAQVNPKIPEVWISI